MLNLDGIKSELITQLQSDSKFSFVNTRLILKTGINLRSYRAEEASDAKVVAKVLVALTDQGFTFTRG